MRTTHESRGRAPLSLPIEKPTIPPVPEWPEPTQPELKSYNILVKRMLRMDDSFRLKSPADLHMTEAALKEATFVTSALLQTPRLVHQSR